MIKEKANELAVAGIPSMFKGYPAARKGFLKWVSAAHLFRLKPACIAKATRLAPRVTMGERAYFLRCVHLAIQEKYADNPPPHGWPTSVRQEPSAAREPSFRKSDPPTVQHPACSKNGAEENNTYG